MSGHPKREGDPRARPHRFQYRSVEGLQEINRLAQEGWRVVGATHRMGDWYVLMEREKEG